jgi:putative tryptophan/tyrosine transport system substrate-binding protein
MRRREFITLISGAAAWPLHARAQQRDRIRRIGCLIPADKSDPELQTWFAAFEKRLQALGWGIGRQTLDKTAANWIRHTGKHDRDSSGFPLQRHNDRSCGGDERIRCDSHEFCGVAANAIRIRGPAIVDLQIAHPGGNATGWSNYAPGLSGKWVGLLKEIAPSVRRIVVLFNPITAPYVTGYYMLDLKAAATAFAVELITGVVHEANDLEAVVLGIAREPNGGLAVMPDIFTFVHRKLIMAMADKYRVPAVYPYRHVCNTRSLCMGTRTRPIYVP